MGPGEYCLLEEIEDREENAIVITNKRGAAAYKEDVNIPEEYKFEDGVSPNEITEFIRKCLKEYDQRIGDLEGYRTAILGEKSLFAEDVERIFM